MRPSYDKTFMDIALILAKRSTCLRRKVGCVIVDNNNRILSTGYNGTPSKLSHCDKLGCSKNAVSGVDLSSCGAIHAEQNAIARLILPDLAHTIYVTTQPCESCMKLIHATKITRIIYNSSYPQKYASVFNQSKIKMEQYNAK